jgi:site-specific recombinase XerD
MNQDTNDQKNHQVPWNKGKLIGQKSPLKLKEIWEIRIRLQMTKNIRELALFNLAIDSKLRGCDLVTLRISDVAQSNRVSSQTIIMQQKTHRLVQFEITEQTRDSLEAWISQAKPSQAQIGSISFSESNS